MGKSEFKAARPRTAGTPLVQPAQCRPRRAPRPAPPNTPKTASKFSYHGTANHGQDKRPSIRNTTRMIHSQPDARGPGTHAPTPPHRTPTGNRRSRPTTTDISCPALVLVPQPLKNVNSYEAMFAATNLDAPYVLAGRTGKEDAYAPHTILPSDTQRRHRGRLDPTSHEQSHRPVANLQKSADHHTRVRKIRYQASQRSIKRDNLQDQQIAWPYPPYSGAVHITRRCSGREESKLQPPHELTTARMICRVSMSTTASRMSASPSPCPEHNLNHPINRAPAAAKDRDEALTQRMKGVLKDNTATSHGHVNSLDTANTTNNIISRTLQDVGSTSATPRYRHFTADASPCISRKGGRRNRLSDDEDGKVHVVEDATPKLVGNTTRLNRHSNGHQKHQVSVGQIHNHHHANRRHGNVNHHHHHRQNQQQQQQQMLNSIYNIEKNNIITESAGRCWAAPISESPERPRLSTLADNKDVACRDTR